MKISRVALEYKRRRSPNWSIVLFWMLLLRAAPARAQEPVDAGVTGFDVKRPVLAAACPNGCPWGELGDFVKEAMQPLGYEVLLCRNCNRDQGPPLVSKAAFPPQLSASDTFTGTTTRVDAPVDFGITSSGALAWAYAGSYNYMQDGPYSNLRLIAKIEDPTYLLMAVKADSNITDLSQLASRQMKVTILGGGSPISQPVLDYYGLTQSAVMSWGGSFADPIVAGATGSDSPFDIVINELASPANNPESAVWTQVSQRYNLRFLDLPEEVLDRLAKDKTLGVERVTAKWGLLRGVDRPIATVARTGHAVFARDDMPTQAAYDTAKAIDEHRSALKWNIRPYSYDSHTVWDNFGVPLHPGAEKYYREMGYLPGAAGNQACEAAPGAAVTGASGGGCGVVRGSARGYGVGSFAAGWVPLFVWGLRRRWRYPGRVAAITGPMKKGGLAGGH